MRSKKTVFSFKDIALLWGETNANAARVRINYYVRNNKLHRINRGLYAKDKNYDRLELATRIFTPSYVSFETVLSRHGINFQYYDQIFAASYLTRKIVYDGQAFLFRKIKDTVLFNQDGIEIKNGRSIATKERAFLDTLYLHTDYHFDNLSPLDWRKVFDLLPMYGNKRMAGKVKELCP